MFSTYSTKYTEDTEALGRQLSQGVRIHIDTINTTGRSYYEYLEIQDGERTPYWKPLNQDNSATAWQTATKVGVMTYVDHVNSIGC